MVENSDSVAVAAPGEDPVIILANIIRNIPTWSQSNPSLDLVEISRLSGLSNACYRVALKDGGDGESQAEPLLYRKFLCTVSNRDIEKVVFKTMAESGYGPKLYYECEDFRIE